jgi:tetratricopeptide (TPR) repeat protein
MAAPLAAAFLLAWQAAGPSFDANTKLARQHLAEGNAAGALPFLEAAHRQNPTHAATQYDLALAYIETRQYGRARDFLRGLLDRADSADLRNLLGVAEDRAGAFETAAAEFERAARLDPSERNLFDLGNHLVAYGGFGEGAKVFEYAIGRHPKSARLHVGLGVALYSMSRYDAAVESLCRAVDLDPADPRALEFLGKMQGASPAMAKEVSGRLAGFVKRFPGSAAARFYYAMSLRELQADLGQVEAHLKRAAELDPNMVDAHLQLGALHDEVGKLDAAIADYTAALKLTDSETAHWRLAHIYRRQGRIDLAKIHLEAGARLRRNK